MGKLPEPIRDDEPLLEKVRKYEALLRRTAASPHEDADRRTDVIWSGPPPDEETLRRMLSKYEMAARRILARSMKEVEWRDRMRRRGTLPPPWHETFTTYDKLRRDAVLTLREFYPDEPDED